MMKKYKILSVFFIAMGFFACESEEFLEFEKANSVITSSEYPGYSAVFTTIDDVIIPLQAENASNVEVTTLVGNSTDGFQFTSYSESFNSSTLTLNDTWNNLAGQSAKELRSNEDQLQIRFTAEANGESSYRDFDISYQSPLDVEAAPTAFTDSTYKIKVEAETMNATISEINFYYKAPGDTVFALNPFETFTVNALEDLDSIYISFPGEDSIDFSEILSYRVEAVATSGLFDQVDIEVAAVEVPLDSTGSFTLLPDDFVIAPSIEDDTATTENEATPAVLDESNNGFDFSKQALVADSVPADIRLGVSNDELVLNLGTGVEAVISEPNATFDGFQSARDAFNAGNPSSMDIGDLLQLEADNRAIILSIPDLANSNTGSGEFVVLRISNITLNNTEVDPAFDPITNSQISLEYEGNIYEIN